MLVVDDVASPVVGDADGVEADRVVAGQVAALGHPGGRQAADAELLAPPDRQHRALGPVQRAAAAGLDLDEDQRAAVEGDDVELAVAGAGVALDDLPGGAAEALGDQVLGRPAEALAGLGHGDDGRAAGRLMPFFAKSPPKI